MAKIEQIKKLSGRNANLSTRLQESYVLIRCRKVAWLIL